MIFSAEDVRASSASALLASTLQRPMAERLQFGSAQQRGSKALARGYRRAGGSDVLGRETLRTTGTNSAGPAARPGGSGVRAHNARPAN